MLMEMEGVPISAYLDHRWKTFAGVMSSLLACRKEETKNRYTPSILEKNIVLDSDTVSKT